VHRVRNAIKHSMMRVDDRARWLVHSNGAAAVGWTWRDGFRYAPNGSIWFGPDPIDADLHEFRDRMRRRRDRIRDSRESCTHEHRVPTDETLEDMENLLAALDRLLEIR
jgi:hypothetical protein